MILSLKARTALALGLPNLGRVLWYRAGVLLGFNPVRRIRAQLLTQDFFVFPSKSYHQRLKVNGLWCNQHGYFGWYQVDISTPPKWHTNPFNGYEANASNKKLWWQLPDFDTELGDIKTIWEASRFDWVITFAQLAAQGDSAALEKLNAWLTDWCVHNPAYFGHNWKCGQEASIRVMHLAIAARLLHQHQQATFSLQVLIKAHLQRIAPTIQYAIAQDNNHGTSEAAALFIGGSWLILLGDNSGKYWETLGRKWLENRAEHLIGKDGSFSQYSVTYHRLMLDTYCIAEYWRNCLMLPEFSANLYTQLSKAAYWLCQMTQAETGDAPNLGANDGANLLPLSNTDYRDFRPTVQLATALFCKCCAYDGEGEWNMALKWLDIPLPMTVATPLDSVQFADGGYSLLRQGHAFALLRFPHFRFRPSQADALHVDLWVKGENLLRDAGTYSYNAGDDSNYYFGGTASHNTIQFDDRDQMPRISRFLFGEWLQSENIIPVHEQADRVCAAAGYQDYLKAAHYRTVSLSANTLTVKDKVAGFKHKAIMRWRLLPGEWRINTFTVTNGEHSLRITSDVLIKRFEIIQGWESRYYLQKTVLPVLEIEIHQPGELITEYQFSL